ncbi:hypothetical protein ACFFGH_04470 [Lysobacter korlensis]|uniref:Uncharacterized protein n=1 Tax=Lysobacter korlensis TaxID=553636 RepID=A0ABV6RJE5_9GAMM
MSAFARLFVSTRFGARRPDPRHLMAALRAVFEPRKPRHRALRFLLGLAGVALLAVLVVVAVVIGALMLAFGLGYRLLGGGARRTGNAPSRVVEGQYRVVRRPVLPASH